MFETDMILKREYINQHEEMGYTHIIVYMLIYIYVS